MNNIILIGFMGTGKTAISNLLAEELGREILDTDKLIAEQAGKPISDIFSENGEPFFRELESNILKSLLIIDEKIISTGGGIILNENNRSLLKKMGRVVLLEASPQVIIDRLKGDTTRPLLQGSNAEKLSKISELLKVRQTLYEETADLIIDTSELSQENVIEEITRSITKAD
ncbi:MAG: shikimate kinase [Candidatus Margulisiibacteriota bacterium]